MGDRERRRRSVERIRESRISQLEVKAYKEVMRKLEQHEKLLEIREAKMEGRTTPQRTPEEEERLRQQQHVRADGMSDVERERLEREREQMWSSIPAHVRAKSEALLKGH